MSHKKKQQRENDEWVAKQLTLVENINNEKRKAEIKEKFSDIQKWHKLVAEIHGTVYTELNLEQNDKSVEEYYNELGRLHSELKNHIISEWVKVAASNKPEDIVRRSGIPRPTSFINFAINQRQYEQSNHFERRVVK